MARYLYIFLKDLRWTTVLLKKMAFSHNPLRYLSSTDGSRGNGLEKTATARVLEGICGKESPENLEVGPKLTVYG